MTEVARADRKVARAELVKRVLIVVTALMVLGVLMLLVVLLGQVRANQKLTQSCVTPGRSCYERGQKQTAKAVGDISRVIILAAACAGDLPSNLTATQRADLISACVTKRMTESPTPPPRG